MDVYGGGPQTRGMSAPPNRPRRSAASRVRRGERGQGTVEYVGVMLLLASVLTAVVAAAKGKDFELTKTITGEIKQAIGKVSPCS